jgi:hypothetical protein
MCATAELRVLLRNFNFYQTDLVFFASPTSFLTIYGILLPSQKNYEISEKVTFPILDENGKGHLSRGFT